MPPKQHIKRIRKQQNQTVSDVTTTVFAQAEVDKFKPQKFVADFLAEKRYEEFEKMANEDAAALVRAKECIKSYNVSDKEKLFQTFTQETEAAMNMLSTQIVELQSKNKTLQELVSEKSQALVAETAKVAVLTENSLETNASVKLQNNEIVQLKASVASLSEQLEISGTGCGTELDDCKKKLANQQTVYNAILDDLRLLLTKMSSGSEDGDGIKIQPSPLRA